MRNFLSNPLIELLTVGIIIAGITSGSAYLSTGILAGPYQHAVDVGAMQVAEKIQRQFIYMGLFYCAMVFLLHKLYIRLFIGGAVANGLAEKRQGAVKALLNKIMYVSCVFSMAAVLAVVILRLPS